MHWLELVAAVVVLYRPALQSVQDADPAEVWYDPAGHALQVLGLVRAVLVLYRPALHAVQPDAPALCWYCPGPQAEH